MGVHAHRIRWQFLCCRRVGPPPQFEELPRLNMPLLISGFLSGFVFDDPLPIAGNAVIPISPLSKIVHPTSIGHGVPVASNEGSRSLNHHFLLPQSVGVSGWFSRGPSHIWNVFTGGEILPFFLLVGGLQSWLFCPLISLALESIEIARGVSRANSGVPQRWRLPKCSGSVKLRRGCSTIGWW